MARFWAIAILISFTSVAVHGGGEKVKEKDKDKAPEKNFEHKGKFADSDPRDAARGGPSQTHVVKLKAARSYTIDMVSTDVDSYLRLLDAKGTMLDEDDDSGGGLNSRIVFNCTKDGEYKLVCTTFGAMDMMKNGNYVLTVKSNVNNAVKPSTSHAQMVGKPAPDFKGDFAVNGAPVRLSDLKGKVVLLDFGEIRSTAWTQMAPVLSQWHKAHKADGLAIVSVTFYTSSIGQKLRFDKTTGEVATAKEADVKSDRTMLGDYATHHKIDYLLMALAKDDAVPAFDAYAVNSYPQLVLIDRKGTVRSIHLGNAKNSAEVESEITKLLAEK